jgi:PAS domain S-box-containing protein
MHDDGRGAASPEDRHTYREQVEQLVRRLTEAEGSILELAAGEIDAVVDPATSAPILLSRAQAAVARSEARYRDLVNRAPSIVCELTPDGETLFVNDAVRTLLGHDPGWLRGRNWWAELVPAGERERAEAMRREMARGDVTGFELVLVAADGRMPCIAWNSANRYSSAGELESVVLFGVDVTHRREAEVAARRLAEERMARAEAEAANHAKMEFLAVMSHELRTPLNAIAGYVDLLDLGIGGPVTPQQTEYIQRIRRSQEHLLTLINDVLNFARLEAGRVEFQLEEVCVREVLETARAVTEPQARAKQLTFHCVDCDASLTVRGDRERAQQVLINLLTNAIKYTPAGGRVEMDCAPHPDAVAISVRDTGPGIPPEKLETIFEPFVQLTDPANERPDGVGLGLAISRSLARAMHGDLLVESAPGRGSSFTLVLPRNP